MLCIVFKRYIRHHRITDMNSENIFNLLAASCSDINIHFFNFQVLAVALCCCHEMNWFCTDNSVYHLSRSGADPYSMCRKAGQMEASEHDNAKASVVLNILYHEAACIQMGIQLNNRTQILPGSRHPHIQVVHCIILDIKFFAVICNRADDILLEAAWSKCIGKLAKHFYIHRFFLFSFGFYYNLYS